MQTYKQQQTTTPPDSHKDSKILQGGSQK